MDSKELVHGQSHGREHRRRRRPSSGYQEERGSSLSREGNTSPVNRNSSDVKDGGDDGGVDITVHKRRIRRKNSHEHATHLKVVNGSQHHQRSGKERQRQRKESPSKRMPRSVSEEVLAMEGKFPVENTHEEEPRVEQKRARRTRRRDTGDHGEQIFHEDSGTASGGYHSAERGQSKARARQQPARKKRKNRNAFITSGEEDNYQADVDGEVSEIFKVDKDDVITYEAIQSPNRVPALSAPTLPSQPLNYLFIEKKDGQGFAKENRTKLARVEEEDMQYAKEIMNMHRTKSSIDLALQIHLAFRTSALFCHGLLSGIALTQCVFVYTLSGPGTVNFLNNYFFLALPFQSIYYFLVTICTVSVLDRFANIGTGCRELFLGLLTYPSRALALLVYLIGLFFSLGLVQLDDRISLYQEDKTLWTSLGLVSTWKILNIFRVAGAIAGWLFVSVNTVEDQMAKNLASIADRENNTETMDRGTALFSV